METVILAVAGESGSGRAAMWRAMGLAERSDIHEMACQGGRRRHLWRHEMGAAAIALPTLEIAV